MSFKSLNTIKDFDFGVGSSNNCVRVSTISENQVSGSEVDLILWILLEHKYGEIKRTQTVPSLVCQQTGDQVDCATGPSTYTISTHLAQGLHSAQQSSQGRQYAENLLRCVGVNVPFKQLTSSERKRLFQQFCESSNLLLTEKYSSILDLYEALRRRSKFKEQFNVLSLLGEGKYGKVFAVQLKNSLMDKTCSQQQCTQVGMIPLENNMFAVKKISLSFDALEDVKMILNESAILKRLKGHPNIVTFYNSWLAMEFEHDESDSKISRPFEDSLGEDKLVFYVQMELCGISLHQWKLSLKEDRPSEEKCLLIAKQLADGVFWIHKNGFLHLDVNPRNIFWKNANQDILKIGDYGLAVQSDSFLGRRGTPPYCASEINMTTKSDMFSVGATLFQMAQVLPTRSELISKFDRQDFVTGMKTLDQILPKLLDAEPSNRWDAFELQSYLGTLRF